MASSSQLTIAICSLLLLFPLVLAPVFAHVSSTPYSQAEKHVDVVVEGIVYCQGCEHYSSWSLTEPEPIPSAKLVSFAKKYQNQVSYYKSYETDVKGYFFAPLDGFKMSHNILDHPLQSCHLKLLSSPLHNCSLFSNVNYGINGASLRCKNKILQESNYEAVIYAAGPIAFRPVQ